MLTPRVCSSLRLSLLITYHAQFIVLLPLRFNRSSFALRLTLCLGLSFFGCECTSSQGASVAKTGAEPQTEAKQEEAEQGTIATPTPKTLLGPKARCRDALLRGHYPEAAQALDAMPEATRSTATWHYARAFTALELNQHEAALRLLQELEAESMTFQQAIVSLQERAARQSQDINLIQLFSQDNESRQQQLALAEAELDNKNPQAALQIAEKLLSKLRKQKKSAQLPEAIALAARASVELQQSKRASALYLELAEKWPTTSAAKGSDLQWEKLSQRKLSAQQRFKRADRFSDLGRIKETEEELRLLAKAPAPRVASSEVKGVIAWAWYRSRSNYKKAAELFMEAAKAGGKHKKRALYYEAKSKARADEDLEALKLYAQLSHLGGEFADHASYQLGRLNYIIGDFAAAILAYQDYQKRYRRGRHRKETTRELAVALLGAEQPILAAKHLNDLLKKESSSRSRAQLEELLGLAALQQGDLKQAEKLFRKVIKDRPLSFPALVAEKRLRQLKLPLPSRFAAQSSATPSSKVQQPPAGKAGLGALQNEIFSLDALGLVALAEKIQRAEETTLKAAAGKSSGKALCSAYERLQAGRRQYQVAQWAAKWPKLKQRPQGEARWHWLCIYPRPYQEIIKTESARRAVDPAFIYAIMRQESAFRPAVVSPAQAVGLMQIIGPTAKNIAREIESTYSKERMTLPGLNIEYGAYYIAKLLKQFDQHLVLAAAGYNAGPYAAARWLRSGHQLPLEVFVARIPYRETRNYVYRVLGNYARYRVLLNDAEDQIDLLPLSLSMPQGDQKLKDAY